MRQAELCDWALDPALFTSLCDSLNRFFTQKGMITSGNNSPLALGAPHSLQVPPFTSNSPPTLASLTHPSPLPYSPTVPPTIGAQPPRRALHMQGQGLQRAQLTQPASTAGKTWTSCSKSCFNFYGSLWNPACKWWGTKSTVLVWCKNVYKSFFFCLNYTNQMSIYQKLQPFEHQIPSFSCLHHNCTLTWSVFLSQLGCSLSLWHHDSVPH